MYIRAPVECARAVALMLLWLSGCQTTTLSTTWKDPSVASLSFNRMAVVVLNSSPAERRAQEDTFAGGMTKVKAVPSYSFIPDELLKDTAKAKQRVIDGGFDGALIVRLVDTRQETSYVPPSVSTWDDGWSWVEPSYHVTPGYTVTDTFIRAEISLYSVPSGKLLWSGASETMNPSNARAFAGEVAKATANELRKQGMIH